MGVSLHRDDSTQRLVLTATGVLGFGELERFLELVRDPGVLDYAVLWDMRDILLGLSASDLIRIRNRVAALDRGRPRQGPVALLVHTDAAFAFASAYVVLAQTAGYRVQAFRSAEAADAWLDEVRVPGSPA